jgi:heme/copper-type cytochrome/quinol oxidase subunit 3
MKISRYHFWHIVNLSPWPVLLSLNIFCVPLGLVTFFQGYFFGLPIFYFGLICVLVTMYVWFRDIVREATFEGFHTKQVQHSLSIGMILFIFSEVMFFFAFFWAFFWSSITPTIALNVSWPPVGMESLIFSPWDVPLLNTLILLLSGVTITISHLYIKQGDFDLAGYFGALTVGLAEAFIIFQGFEYFTAPFDISDGVYGSTFFLCTGFHGFHVIIGTIFILVMTFRIIERHFSRQHHFGFEAAAWYWHFVDVVWLFLFVSIYYWGWDMVSSTIFLIQDSNNVLFLYNL